MIVLLQFYLVVRQEFFEIFGVSVWVQCKFYCGDGICGDELCNSV